MISGLNQEVQLLGKTFHFQTELSGPAGLSVRTEVFVGGKVIATRSLELEADDAAGEDSLRSRMKQHHQQTIQTFIQRARRYHLRVPDTEPGVPPPPLGFDETLADPLSVSTLSAKDPSGSTERDQSCVEPPAPAAGEMAHTINVRRFFGRFRQLLGPVTFLPKDLPERLIKAGEAFEWMINSSLFMHIRIDEQARCNLLSDQIREWMAGDRDHMQAAQIWSGVITFSNYLGEVNHRTELISHDQQLLVWALDEVQCRGMSADVLQRLESLYGRHPRLDELLDESEEVTAMAWTAHLRSVLTLL